MELWHTKRILALPGATAPDGSDVRVLLRLAGGSMAHFELAPNQTSIAVTHRTVAAIVCAGLGPGKFRGKLS